MNKMRNKIEKRKFSYWNHFSSFFYSREQEIKKTKIKDSQTYLRTKALIPTIVMKPNNNDGLEPQDRVDKIG